MKHIGTWCCIFIAAGAFVVAVWTRPFSARTDAGSVQTVAQDTPPDDDEPGETCADVGAPRPMVPIRSGSYRPFYKQAATAGTRSVDAFLLDEKPVTRGEYLAFVMRRPAWRKSRVDALFAESAYLSDWRGDLDPGRASLEQPANFVSWFAAKAYCECHGKRLPTVIEWEWAAGADAGAAGADANDSPFQFAMGRRAAGSASDLRFSSVWEWTSDFNSVLISGRSDTASGASLFCGDGYRANDARDYAGFLRHSFRASLKAGYTLKNLGFRCAKDAR
jgi:formylglycine-generating enzyme required for sulfatase activity